MQNRNILSTDYAEITGMRKSVSKVVDFLLNEGRSYVLDDSTMNDIMTSKWSTNSPLSEIFENICDSEVRNIYTGILPSTGRNTVSVPDLLGLSSISIDTHSLNDDILNHHPIFKDKVILNLGGILKFIGIGNRAAISDTTLLHLYTVRGALCRSYALANGPWLTPSLAKFIIKTYAMVVSAEIAKMYGLSYAEQATPAFFLALYITKKVLNTVTIPNPSFLFDFLGEPSFVRDMMVRHSGSIEKTNTLVGTCDLIAQTGTDRLNTFDSRLLNQYCANLGTDNISNLIALEYPPYWVTQLILNVSGVKTKILFDLKQYGYDKETVKFVHELASSSSFLKTIESTLEKTSRY